MIAYQLFQIFQKVTSKIEDVVATGARGILIINIFDNNPKIFKGKINQVVL
jgi:hypothetical protein